jgi:hypothetical protein
MISMTMLVNTGWVTVKRGMFMFDFPAVLRDV